MSHQLTEEELCEILINSTDEEALRELFERRTAAYPYWKGSVTQKTGALEDYIRRLSPRHALDYIPFAMKIVVEQSDEILFTTALAMLRNFVRVSKSRELNENSNKYLEAINFAVISKGNEEIRKIWKYITSWYELEQYIPCYKMFKPDKGIILNRPFIYGERECRLLGITEKDDETVVWVIASNPQEESMKVYSPDESYDFEKVKQEMLRPKTNREVMFKQKGYISKEHVNISSFKFDDQEFKVGSSLGSSIFNGDIKARAMMLFFSETIDDLNESEVFNWESQTLYNYSLYPETTFDMENGKYDDEIVLKTGVRLSSYSLEEKMTLPFGKYEEPVDLTFIHPVTGREVFCHILGVRAYDFWKEQEEKGTKLPRFDGMTETEFLKRMKQLELAYEDLCPKGMDLALISYKVDWEGGLQFYATKWLDSLEKTEGNAMGIAIVFSGGDEDDRNIKTCQLIAIPKEFNEAIEVELLRFNEILQEETYIIPGVN